MGKTLETKKRLEYKNTVTG